MPESYDPRSRVRQKTPDPFLRRVWVRNYKSIERCDVYLKRFTVVVGRNAAGKSNFLDALRFVADSLDVTPDHAIKSRGGIDSVRRTSTGHPRNFTIGLDVNLDNGSVAKYQFEIASRKGGSFVVANERAEVRRADATLVGFRREGKSVTKHGVQESLPEPESDRLFLVSASALPALRPLYDGLRNMGFYNLNPGEMKRLQPPDAGESLHSDGSNIASVVARLATEGKTDRLHEFLGVIVPGIEVVERVSLGPSETLQFRQRMRGSPSAWKFYAQSMSDGTLRTIGLLVAVMQISAGKQPVSLIGVEEPETALHPAAAKTLVEALREASERTQILVTCHSPDLLDAIDVEREQVLAVQAEGGTTRIGLMDQASTQAIKDHLYMPGELLRMDQLEPDAADLARQDRQLDLFATPFAEVA